MGVLPKPPGLIAFEGLFELYDRSGGLLPDPLKTSFQNIFPKCLSKISFQNVLSKYDGNNSFNIQVNYEVSKSTG
jgi:hypothetical protein